jgi:hypothetical protein
VKPRIASSAHILAFGDFGLYLQKGQVELAAAMRQYNEAHPFDVGITLGDNLYDLGFTNQLYAAASSESATPNNPASPFSPRSQREYEDLYGSLGIQIYASLGSHDVG